MNNNLGSHFELQRALNSEMSGQLDRKIITGGDYGEDRFMENILGPTGIAGLTLSASQTLVAGERINEEEQIQRQTAMAGSRNVPLTAADGGSKIRFSLKSQERLSYLRSKQSQSRFTNGDMMLSNKFAISSNIEQNFNSQSSGQNQTSRYLAAHIKTQSANNGLQSRNKTSQPVNHFPTSFGRQELSRFSNGSSSGQDYCEP